MIGKGLHSPHGAAKLKPAIFFIGLKKSAVDDVVGWRVSYWVPRASAVVPDTSS